MRVKPPIRGQLSLSKIRCHRWTFWWQLFRKHTSRVPRCLVTKFLTRLILLLMHPLLVWHTVLLLPVRLLLLSVVLLLTTRPRLPAPSVSPPHMVAGTALSQAARITVLSLLEDGLLLAHCDRHLGGFLEGDLPLDWLHNVVYGVCGVCNRILCSRFRGRCPSCWPAFVESTPVPFLMIFLPLTRFSFLGFPLVLLSPLGPGIFGVAASMPPSRESLPIGTLGRGWIF